MKNLIVEKLEDVVDMWIDGVSYLFGDSLISFYTFITLILAECAYLWAFCRNELAIPFSAIILGYILNVVFCALFKGLYEGERKELFFAILYIIVFVVLFVIGCFINIGVSIILTVIPFFTTALWIQIREFQICMYVGIWAKIVMFISKLFRNKIFNFVSQIIVVGAPYVVFVACLVQISTIYTWIKITISVLYFICIPFIAYYEDTSASQNIYELAYELMWSKEYDEQRKKIFEKLEGEDESEKIEILQYKEVTTDEIE